MIYVTQATVDFKTAARRHLQDNYAWHKAIWECFPGKEARDYLTRLDRRRGAFRLLIVSASEPARPEWCSGDEEGWKTKPVPETFLARSRYRFQLCANPTKKVASGPDGALKKNGRRVPLNRREDLVGWIERKGEQGGFRVDEETLRTYVRGREYFRRKGEPGMHSAVEFEGVLGVTDEPRFRETFRSGVGSAKAFGFGLLVLAPVS